MDGMCLVFCAAGFDGLITPVGERDHIIAADGGLTHVRSLGLVPGDIIGDFDSLGYVPEDGTVFPVEKDDTDSMLALRRGLSLGYTRFLIYGGLDGKRLDHTIANFQALRFLAEQGARGTLVGRDYLITVIKNDTLRFPAGMAGDISVFCPGPDARGVDISGLYYETDGVTLSGSFPLGVSNHFTGAPASVGVRDGCLLVMWVRQGEKENYYGI